MEPGGSRPHSQGLCNNPCTEPNKLNLPIVKEIIDSKLLSILKAFHVYLYKKLLRRLTKFLMSLHGDVYLVIYNAKT